MRVEISSQYRLKNKLRDSIERRLRFVMGRFAGRVRRVAVLLTDLDLGHGKTAKRCKIVVQLVRSGQVCVEDTAEDFQSVAERMTERVGQAVQRALERRQAAERPEAAAVS